MDTHKEELNLITFQGSSTNLSTPLKILLLFLSSQMPHIRIIMNVLKCE